MACSNGVCGISKPNTGANMATPITMTEIQEPKKGFGTKVGEAIAGKPASYTPIPTKTDEQSKAISSLLNQILPLIQGQAGKQPQVGQLGGQQFQGGIQQLLQQLLGKQGQNRPDTFAPIENRARTQFEQSTIPSLAERFTSMGGDSKQGSSAFTGALGQAGAGLEQGLAALRSQYGLQERGQNTRENLANQGLLGQLLGAQGQQQGLGLQQQQLNQGGQGQYQNLLLSLLGQGLGSTFNPIYQPATGGLLGGLANIGNSFASGTGNALAKYSTGG